jgi:hypothetical protein
MSEKDNSVPLFSFFECERQARIKRNLVIQACVRGIVRALAEWLRSLILGSTQLARDLVDRGAQFDGQIAAVNAQILSRASLLSIVAFRLCAVAGFCLVTAGTTVAESATGVSPICAAADLRLITLIEAHGEAQDVAAEILAQAFFTVMEARKACNQGHVELAIKLYESVPLPAVTSLRR